MWILTPMRHPKCLVDFPRADLQATGRRHALLNRDDIVIKVGLVLLRGLVAVDAGAQVRATLGRRGTRPRLSVALGQFPVTREMRVVKGHVNWRIGINEHGAPAVKEIFAIFGVVAALVRLVVLAALLYGRRRNEVGQL